MRRQVVVVVVVAALSALSAACPGPGPGSDGRDPQCDEFDGDGDGFPRPNSLFLCCDAPEFTCGVDCNDEEPDIHPSGFSAETFVDDEPGDGIDQNCDNLDGNVGEDDV